MVVNVLLRWAIEAPIPKLDDPMSFIKEILASSIKIRNKYVPVTVFYICLSHTVDDIGRLSVTIREKHREASLLML